MATSSMLALDTHKTNVTKSITLFVCHVGGDNIGKSQQSHTYKASFAKDLHGLSERKGWPYHIL